MLAAMDESTPRNATARLARERRIHTLRMRVVAIAVALFVAAWAGLFVQLISGHDPALASSTSSVATQSADPSVTDDGWSDDGSGDDSTSPLTGSDSTTATPADAELSGSGSSSQSSAPATVTTGQS